MINPSLFLYAEGTNTLQLQLQDAFLSNLLRVESHNQEARFRTTRHSLPLPRAAGGQGWWFFQRSCSTVSSVRGSAKGVIYGPVVPCGAFHYLEPAARYFPWQGLKNIYTSYLAVSAGCQSLSATACTHPTFFRPETKPSVMYVKALGQTWCSHSQCKIACCWFSLMQKPLMTF